MAIPNDYIDKITNKDSGESRIISPAADKVRVDNENFEGTDLDEVLDEVAAAIDEAGSGDGTVTGVKVGNTPYGPDGQGVVDLSTPFAGKVDKNGTDSLMTAAEHTKLQNLPTAAELEQAFSGKQGTLTFDDVPTANSNNLVKSGGIKTALDNLLQNLTIGQNGNWYVGQTDTNVKAQGPAGNVNITDASDLVAILVNDLTTGGAGNILSAEMGKVLGARVAALEDAVEELDEGAGYDISVTETAIVFTSRNMPHVSVGDVGNHNVSCKAGNTATTSFYVSGRKLTSAIQIAVSDATNWSVSTASITPTDGKVALTLVTITYHPAAGTTAGTTHNCNVVVSSGGTTFGTIAMVGTVAAAPSITLTMSSATITTTQDTPATATLNVKGAALEGDITLAISGTGFTLSTAFVSKADAESAAGADVTVTFDGSASGDATITASSTNATNATAAVSGVIPTPLEAGSYFIVPASNGNGSLKYTVLADGNVSVKSNGGLSSTTDNPLVIPATVNDSDATAVYNSGGTAISASGLSYNVTELTNSAFYNIGNIRAVVLSEGLKKIGTSAFQSNGITKLVLPSTMTTLNAKAFIACASLNEVEFLNGVWIEGSAFKGCTALMKVILNGNGIGNSAFLDCTQFTNTSGNKPVVINRKETAYQYRANGTITPFPQNSSSKVWAKLYVPDVSGYVNNNANTYWGCFDEVLDINTYTE